MKTLFIISTVAPALGVSARAAEDDATIISYLEGDVDQEDGGLGYLRSRPRLITNATDGGIR